MTLPKLPTLARALPLSFLLTACGPVGGLEVSESDPATGTTRKTYSKYFDDGQWLLKDQVGLSVVIDNETPVGRQMFGSLNGTDSEGTGKVTVYFWNFDSRPHRVGKVRISHRGTTRGTHDSSMLAAASPWSRTGAAFGELPIDPYATELKVDVSVEVDGKAVVRPMVLKRRTVDENRRFFGPGGKPPYPWAGRL
jgi:hypothetical protein